MRGFSSLASRASSPAFTNLSKQNHNSLRPITPKPSNLDSVATTSCTTTEQTSPGKSSLNWSSNTSIAAKNRNLQGSSIDYEYFTQILARNDWYLLLNHEYKAKRVASNQQAVVSILHNQENPLHPFKFYIWISNICPSFAKNQSVKGVLGNVLHRKGPLLLLAELVLDIRNSRNAITVDLLCVLIGSWGRLGLGKYCADILEQVSYLGFTPSTRLYNAVIDTLVKSNSLDLAYLKF